MRRTASRCASTPNGLSPCFVVVQLKNGNFTRVYPKKKGTFDCKPSNLATIQADFVGG